ncbi:MAG TPA: AAA family ATPase [Terriglobales bacterium]|nr:AAA family ATPase [Terriglobales bacterium]
MRKWMRERLKRRKKKNVSEVEATGRIGQPLPSGAEPLRPSYPEAMLRGAEAATPQPREAQPARETPRQPARETPRQHAAAPRREEPRLVMETQPESPTMPPAKASEATLHPPAAKSPKAPKGVVVLTIGLPGSGKTTWYKRRGVTPLSSDLLRNILFDDITEQRYQSLVFSTLRSLLRARLIAKMPWNYVDATNLSPGERRQWIKMAKGFGYEVQAVFFDVPLDVCLERNKRRERVVPEDIMRRMAAKLKAPSFEEGFSKIVVVRVKKSD